MNLLLYLSSDYEPLLFFFSNLSFSLACLLSSRSVFDHTTLAVSLWPSFPFSSFSSFSLFPPLILLGMKGLVCEFWGSIKYPSYLKSKRGLSDHPPQISVIELVHFFLVFLVHQIWLSFKPSFLSYFFSKIPISGESPLWFEFWDLMIWFYY